jgi:hypothetical protein
VVTQAFPLPFFPEVLFMIATTNRGAEILRLFALLASIARESSFWRPSLNLRSGHLRSLKASAVRGTFLRALESKSKLWERMAVYAAVRWSAVGVPVKKSVVPVAGVAE